MIGTIAIAHEHIAVCEALEWALQFSFDIEVTVLTATAGIENPESTLLLTDIPCFKKILNPDKLPLSTALLITDDVEEDSIIECIRAGACDCIDISKGPDVIVAWVEKYMQEGRQGQNMLLKKLILAGNTALAAAYTENDHGLTAREKLILQLMTEGKHLKLIGQMTNTSYDTVRTHVKRIYRKLGVNSSSEAVLKAMKMRF